MKSRQEIVGKISDHFRGVGTVTRDMVLQRALELARINGHEHHTQDDWNQARRELMGDFEVSESSGEEDSINAVTDWDETPGTSGHHVPNQAAPDEQTFAETLAEEGVNEAEHERMFEASRRTDI
ncbi:MAG: hypothetical protein JWM68_940 [Verrucomicrobiales bacterium]|nr:hypothetical protein [Verrucomicrobiales bacterium]